jgi:2-C-methyl-D-erythritol 4-phosphate cytidylyltransferase
MTFVTLVRCGDVGRPETIWSIVVGGGSGERFGAPKQYAPLGDRRVIDFARDTAAAVSEGVIVVVPQSDAEHEGGVPGGLTRSQSVRNGLRAVPEEATIICVHDAARPFADEAMFRRVIEAVEAGADGAVPVIAVADTIKVVDDGVVVDTPDRSTLVAVQTPQAFRAERLRAAHRSGGDATDDAALVEQHGGRVVVVEGDPANRKITHPEDLEWARRVAAAQLAPSDP